MNVQPYELLNNNSNKLYHCMSAIWCSNRKDHLHVLITPIILVINDLFLLHVILCSYLAQQSKNNHFLMQKNVRPDR